MKNVIMAIIILFLFGIKANGQQILINGKATLMSGNGNKTALVVPLVPLTPLVPFAPASPVSPTVFINQDEDGHADGEKTKFYSKSYNIDKNDKVSLSNKFGSINIITWNKNEVKIDAEIKAYANTAAEAQKLIDGVEATSNKESDLISYKTNMETPKGSWGIGSRNGKNWRKEIKVNVTVYMPAGNALTASQQYGNIQMNDFFGPTSITVQYGNFTANSLKSNNNYIKIQYGKCDIKEASQAKINHQYGGGLTIGSIGEIELVAQYTNVNIGEIKQMSTIKQQYGSGITIGSAGPLSAMVQYSTLKIGNLQGSLTSKVQYGKVNIDEVKEDCKAIVINADYSEVNLGFSPNYNANFDLITNYGSFKYEDNVSAKKLGDDDKHYSSSKIYSGTVGNGGSNTITIKANYGVVTFK
jgi:hypothetical protein